MENETAGAAAPQSFPTKLPNGATANFTHQPTDADIQEATAAYDKQGQSAQQANDAAAPGLFHSIIQSIAAPALRDVASIAGKPMDFGYLGTATPFTDVWDGVSDNLDLASYFVGGEGTFATQALKFAGLQAGSKVASDLSQGQTAPGTIATDAALSGAESALGLGLVHGAGNVLSSIGTKMLQTDAGKAVGSYITNLASQYAGITSKAVGASDIAGMQQAQSDALREKGEGALKQLTTYFGSKVFDTDRAAAARSTVVSSGMSDAARDYENSLMRQVDANYDQFQNSTDMIASTPEGKAAFQARLSGPIADAKDAIEQGVKNVQYGGMTNGLSQLQSTVGDVERFTGNLARNGFGLRDAYQYAVGMAPPPGLDGKSYKMFTGLKKGLLDGIEASLKADGKTDTLDLWGKSREAFNSVDEKVKAFGKDIWTSGKNPAESVTAFAKRAAKAQPETISAFKEGVSSAADKKLQDNLEQTVLNQVGREAMKTDGTFDPKVLSKYAETFGSPKNGGNGFLNAENIERLKSLQLVASRSWDDVMATAKDLGSQSSADAAKTAEQQAALRAPMDKALQSGQPSQVLEVLKGAKSPEQAQAFMSGLTPEQKQTTSAAFLKSVVDQAEGGGFIKNADGTWDVSGALKQLHSIKDDVLGELLPPGTKDDLDKLIHLSDSSEDLKNVPNAVGKAGLTALFSVLLHTVGHPGSALYQAGKAGMEALSKSDDAKTVDEIVQEVEANNGTIPKRLMTRLFGAAGKAVKKKAAIAAAPLSQTLEGSPAAGQ